ncbi:MAG: LysM peptidoglycan-binding domain-containing protein [Fibrobacter sp.]|nr:LysM peptidoglycan-binding domain-containing protein [Fibrobacter sp.]
MMYQPIRKLFLYLAVLVTVSFSATASDDPFPTPDILKDRVEFWKKIYAKYSLNDGVIHDRDYMSIVYSEILNDGSVATIRKEKERIIALINDMNATDESKWNDEQKSIAEKFRKMTTVDELKTATERVRYQQGQADRFREGLIRSGMYLDTIRSILKEYGVPERLAYLPHVESSFNTAAYSKVGAAGLWQFMRGTGKLFGMKITYAIDERRDPIIATRGAARYLSGAYNELKAWPIAITSYNHGVNGMKRAVNATGSRDLAYIIQNYQSRSFRFASSNFYSCFLAASEIAMDYKSYFPNVTLHPRLEFNDITLTHHIRPDVLSKYLGLTTRQLIELNPAIRAATFQQHTKLAAGLTIHIPATLTSSNALALMASIPDSLKSKVPDKPKYYKVNKGDNLIAIASRLGVSVQELASENNLSSRNKIVVGQLLRVPVSKPAETVASVVVPQQPKAKESGAVTKGKDTLVVAVENADALLEMAKNELESKLPQEEKETVVAMNDKKKEKKEKKPDAGFVRTEPEDLPVDKVDTPPVLTEIVADSLKDIALVAAAEEITDKTTRPQAQVNFDVSVYNLDLTMSPVGNSAEIVVSVDETIGHYAEWLGVATWKIRKLNNMGRGSDIRLNKKLQLPIEQKDVVDKFIETRLQYHMAIEEDFYSQYKVADVKSRIVKKGETLWDICNQSDNENALPLWLFKKYNKHLDLNALRPGTTIWIPLIAEKGPNDVGNGDAVYPDVYNPFVKPSGTGTPSIRVVP